MDHRVMKKTAYIPTNATLMVPKEPTYRIRVTFCSKNVKNLETACSDLVRGAKDKELTVRGPKRIPTKVLNIATRKSPCGAGTNTWDRYELRVHKRVVDVHSSTELLKQITKVRIEPDVDVEVTIGDRLVADSDI